MVAPDESQLHYDNPDNQNVVADRLAFYKHAEPQIDIHEDEVTWLRDLRRLGSDDGDDREPIVLDSGAGRGIMLPKLVNAGFKGTYLGLDLSLNQIAPATKQALFKSRHATMLQGNSELLPVQDGSIDILFDNLTGYHKNEDQRIRSYHEQHRVTKPEGIVVISTSGVANKGMTRTLEAFVAKYCDSEPPEPIQVDYTCETAEEEIRQHFADWHRTQFVQQGNVVISDEERVDDTIQAVRSVYDQFRPKTDSDATETGRSFVDPAVFEAGLAVVKKSLLQAIEDGYPRIDNVHRTFWFLSRESLGLPDRILLSS